MTHPLQQAVFDQLGFIELDDDARQTLRDIARYGIDGGFVGFTYFTDTIAFFKANRSAILSALAELASDLGESVEDLVVNFRCLGEDYRDEVRTVLYGLDADDRQHTAQVENALAWFAAEEVARWVVDHEDAA